MRLNADNKYYEQNECPVCEVDPFTECKGSQALKDVGVTWQGDFELDMSLKNITDYSPTWPQAKGDDPQELEKMGYLYNGGKADDAIPGLQAAPSTAAMGYWIGSAAPRPPLAFCRNGNPIHRSSQVGSQYKRRHFLSS